MKPRVQLPRASTTASLAETLSQPATVTTSGSQRAAAASEQQLMQLMCQIELFDTKKLFTGAVQADGLLCPDGPRAASTLRCFLPLSQLAKHMGTPIRHSQTSRSLYSTKQAQTPLINMPTHCLRALATPAAKLQRVCTECSHGGVCCQTLLRCSKLGSH